jgi:hypothetical protein
MRVPSLPKGKVKKVSIGLLRMKQERSAECNNFEREIEKRSKERATHGTGRKVTVAKMRSHLTDGAECEKLKEGDEKDEEDKEDDEDERESVTVVRKTSFELR